MIELDEKPVTRSFRLNERVMSMLRRLSYESQRSMSGELAYLVIAESDRLDAANAIAEQTKEAA